MPWEIIAPQKKKKKKGQATNHDQGNTLTRIRGYEEYNQMGWADQEWGEGQEDMSLKHNMGDSENHWLWSDAEVTAFDTGAGSKADMVSHMSNRCPTTCEGKDLK